MADQDLNIRVTSTADLAALNKAKAAIDDIAERTRKVNFAQVQADSERFAASTGLPLPGTPGLSPFGTSGAGTQGLTTVAADMDRVAQASLLAGINISRARNEAVTLIREMAVGAPTTRTFGALVGALGYQIAGLGIALGAPIALTYKMIENEQKLNDELDKQLDSLTKNAHKWQELAQAATTPADVQKVAKEAIPVLEEANEKVRSFAQQGVSWWKQIIDGFTNIGGFGGKIFQDRFDKGLASLSAAAQEAKKLAEGTIHVAEESEKAYDETRLDGFLSKLKDLHDQQNQLARGPTGALIDPQKWDELQDKIDAATKKLEQFIERNERLAKSADAAAKTLAANVATPDAEFAKKQAEDLRKHTAERHALEAKREEAIAEGDDATAKVIQDQLDNDTFRRDQAQARGERQAQLNRDVFSTSKGDLDQFETPSDLPDQFDLPESSLKGIYAQRRSERDRATGAAGGDVKTQQDILSVLTKIYQQWQ